MAKSSSIISGIAALLLYPQHSAARAQPNDWNPTFTVTKSGWMNLRKINMTGPIELPDEYWYVCGTRKVILWSKREQIEEDYELIGRAPDNEFQDEKYSLMEPEKFWNSNAEQARFMSSAVSACSAPPNKSEPARMNLSYSEGGGPEFYYLLTRDFRASGNLRSFWLNSNSARKDKMRVKANSRLARLASEQEADLGEWLTGVDTWWVSNQRNTVARYEINCGSNEIRGLTIVTYRPDGSVEDNDFQPGKFRAIIPDSVADSWREVVCLIK